MRISQMGRYGKSQYGSSSRTMNLHTNVIITICTLYIRECLMLED